MSDEASQVHDADCELGVISSMSQVVRERAFHLFATVGPDDLRVYSDLVAAAHPDAVYFLVNYKKNPHHRPQFPDSKPLRLHKTLSEAIENEASDVPFPAIGIREPWPEDQISGLAEDLIGGRFYPAYGHKDQAEMRRFGKYVEVQIGQRGYKDAAVYVDNNDSTLFIEAIGNLKVSAYPPYSFLEIPFDGPHLLAYYDANNPEISAFCRSMGNLWRRLSTRNAALYDPITGALINAEYRSEKPIGRIALRQASDGSGRIARIEKPTRDSWAIVGERPTKAKAVKSKVR